jgi:hypothetical protein
MENKRRFECTSTSLANDGLRIESPADLSEFQTEPAALKNEKGTNHQPSRSFLSYRQPTPS